MAAIASSSAASSSTALSSDPGVEHLRGVAKALGYPSWEVLDFRAEGARQSRPSREARRFVAFCEHRKIRALPVSERDVCDCDGDAGAWLAAFEAYLEKIGCPSFEDSVASRRRQQLHWLAGHALALEFEDLVASGVLAKKEAAAKRQKQQSMNDASSGAKKAKSSAETNAIFDKNLLKLMEITGVGESIPAAFPDHQSRLKVLRSIEQVIAQKCSRRRSPGMNSSKKGKLSASKSSSKEDGETLLRSLSAGFETGRPEVDRAVLVARMLHVGRLRILQNRINSVLEIGQEFVANPKTDSSLGRVGR